MSAESAGRGPTDPKTGGVLIGFRWRVEGLTPKEMTEFSQRISEPLQTLVLGLVKELPEGVELVTAGPQMVELIEKLGPLHSKVVKEVTDRARNARLN